MCTAGTVRFGTAIAVHPLVGYNDFIHLAPAVAAALVFVPELALSYPAIARGLPADASRATRHVTQG